MSPLESRLAVLKAEVTRDWAQVERHHAIAAETDPHADRAQAALVALSLDHAYQAMEQLLVRVERNLGLPERSGSDWHRQVLSDAALALDGIRPPIIPQEILADWIHLLGFRHFLRHAYAVDLDPVRLRENTERLARAVTSTRMHVEALLAALGARG